MNSTNCVKFHKMAVLKAKPAKQACIWFYLTGQDYILDFPTKRIEGYERPLKKLIWLVSSTKFNQNVGHNEVHIYFFADYLKINNVKPLYFILRTLKNF